MVTRRGSSIPRSGAPFADAPASCTRARLLFGPVAFPVQRVASPVELGGIGEGLDFCCGLIGNLRARFESMTRVGHHHQQQQPSVSSLP